MKEVNLIYLSIKLIYILQVADPGGGGGGEGGGDRPPLKNDKNEDLF